MTDDTHTGSAQCADAREPAEFDREWPLLLALCRCAVLSGSEAATHQVSRLAAFYGDSPRGTALRALFVKRDAPPVRLVFSGGPSASGASPTGRLAARVTESWRYGPQGRENVRRRLRWLMTMEDLPEGTELYAVTPAASEPDASRA